MVPATAALMIVRLARFDDEQAPGDARTQEMTIEEVVSKVLRRIVWDPEWE